MAYIWEKDTPPFSDMPTPNREGEEIIIIDSDLRNISVPASLRTIGVAGDHNAESIFFQIPRYFDGIDLAEHKCLIRYINAKKEYGEYEVTDIAVDVDFIVFAWQIRNTVTRYSGVVNFTVQFETADDTGISYQWQTVPAQLTVLAALPIESTITDKDDTLYRKLAVQVQSLQERMDAMKDYNIEKDIIRNNSDRITYLENNVVYALKEV